MPSSTQTRPYHSTALFRGFKITYCSRWWVGKLVFQIDKSIGKEVDKFSLLVVIRSQKWFHLHENFIYFQFRKLSYAISWKIHHNYPKFRMWWCLRLPTAAQSVERWSPLPPTWLGQRTTLEKTRCDLSTNCQRFAWNTSFQMTDVVRFCPL